VLNVLKNSMEAVPEDGTITISTQLRPVRRLQIHNDGPAILPAVEAKLFSPFFTTKETGQGIGLTLIQEILRNHDFSFGLENEPRGGVVFWVEFE
jgi:signal transduction histidine kinase